MLFMEFRGVAMVHSTPKYRNSSYSEPYLGCEGLGVSQTGFIFSQITLWSMLRRDTVHACGVMEYGTWHEGTWMECESKGSLRNTFGGEVFVMIVNVYK